MKPILITSLVVISCFLFSGKVSAQSSLSTSAKKEIVLEIPGVDVQKNLPAIKNTLKKIEGVSFEGFCNSRKILLLRATDDALYQFMIAMKEQHIVYYIKKNTSLAVAKEACGDSREIDSSFSID